MHDLTNWVSQSRGLSRWQIQTDRYPGLDTATSTCTPEKLQIKTRRSFRLSPWDPPRPVGSRLMLDHAVPLSMKTWGRAPPPQV